MPGRDTEQLLLLPENLEEAAEGQQAHYVSVQSFRVLRASFLAISIGTLIFLQASNTSLLTTTQTVIATDLNTFSDASWFTSAYLVAMSSISPLAGRLCQIFSPRTCIFVSSIIFALGAIVVSIAPAFASFLVGRVVMGIGAAGIFTISIILVSELTGGKRRGLFIGLINSGFTASIALGAIGGGALVPTIGWRVTFCIQASLAASMGTCVLYAVPKLSAVGTKGSGEQPLAHRLAKVDHFGVITLTSSLVILLTSLSSTRISILPIILSMSLFILFIIIESRYAAEPIIPVAVLESRSALLACLAVLGLMISRWTVLLYTPVYAIAVRNWSTALAGSMLLSANGGFAFGGLVVGLIHIRRAGSFYLSCLTVFALFSITLFILSRISTPNSSATAYMITTFANGFCTGAALNYTLAHLLHLTLPQTQFIASSLITTFRGFASSFGSAIGGGLFSRALKSALEKGFKRKGFVRKDELLKKLLGSPALVASLVGDEKEIAINSYVSALMVLFTFAGILALIAIVLQAGTGWDAPAEMEGIDVAHEGRQRDENP